MIQQQEINLVKHIPQCLHTHRTDFLSMCADIPRYFDGQLGLPNHYKTWEHEGEPDFILIREDGWGICFTAENLPKAVGLYDWVKVVIKKNLP